MDRFRWTKKYSNPILSWRNKLNNICIRKKATRAIFCRATIYKKVEEKSKQCDAPENLDVVLHANVSSLEVTIRYL